VTEQSSHLGAIARAENLCGLHRYDEAVAVLSTALAARPDDSHTWCVLARAKLGTEDFQGALEAAGRAVALQPDEEWPHRLASIALSRLGQPRQALAAALESVRLAPMLWQTHARVAGTSLSLRMPEQAQLAANKAVELAPLEPDTWTTLGSVALTRGDRKQATQAFRQALALDPENVNAHDGLARVALKAGRLANPQGLAAAASGFATSVRVDPRSTTSRASLEIVLRAFLARFAYFVFLDSYLVLRITASSNTSYVRLIPLVVLLAPAVFAAKFLAGLTKVVRSRLLQVLRRGLVSVAATLELIAVASIAVGVFAPHRTAIAVVAAVAAGVARLVLMIDLHRVRNGGTRRSLADRLPAFLRRRH
jgi:cytochrome c-type biogenesis protein CcmH/NrfG